MRKEMMSCACALGLLFSASAAYAGAYGEQIDATESPASPPAPAAVYETEEVDYAQVGPYIGLGGVYAIELFDGGMNVDNSNGFHVRAGYRVHPNVAIEARYEHYLGFETDPGPGHFEGWMATANVKGYILTGRFQPFLLFGMGYLNMTYPGTNRAGDANPGDDFAMRFGIGMDTCLTEHIAIGPEVAYVLPIGDVDDLSFVTVALGLQYKF
jgi:opacity protein-like surface antigen